MIIYTIGFTKKTAKEFFNLISTNEIKLLVDIRLNNQSQLAGFAKNKDLEFFLKEICNCEYKHEMIFAPTKDILDDYKSKKITWAEYEVKYNELLNTRDAVKYFYKNFSNYDNVCFLCSEHEAKFCHRRLLAESIEDKIKGIEVKHI